MSFLSIASPPSGVSAQVARCPFYWRCWFVVRDFFQIVAPVRINLIILGLLAVALWFPAQTHDIFIGVAAEKPSFGDFLVSRESGFDFAGISFIGIIFWLTSDSLLRRLRCEVRTSRSKRFCTRALPVALAFAPSLIVAIGFFLTARTPAATKVHSALVWRGWWQVGLGWFVFILSAAFSLNGGHVVGKGEKSWLKFLSRILRLWTSRRRARWADIYSGFACLCFGLSIAMISILTPSYASQIGPVNVLVQSAGFWSFMLCPLLMWLARIRFPFVTLLGLLALISGATDCNDNHAVRMLGPVSANRILGASNALNYWLSNRTDYVTGKPYPVFIVATEGGGIRNTYWTVSALTALADDYPEFRHHLFAISGVSGGSVGAAIYSALIAETESGNGLLVKTPGRSPYSTIATQLFDVATNVLAKDLLSPVLAKGAIGDLAQQIIPSPIFISDRAVALEKALEGAWRETVVNSRFPLGFYGYNSPLRATSSVPFLIFGATEVETGTRFYISHLVPDSGSGSNNVFGLYTGNDLRLSTAAFLSSRFPYVTPVGTLQLTNGGKIRLADGGYFENSATSTVYDLLSELTLRHHFDDYLLKIQRTNIFFVVLSIRYIEKQQRDPSLSGHAFGDPYSPVKTLLNTREARAEFSRVQLDRFCADSYLAGRTVASNVISLKLYGGTNGVPLGWMLSSKTRVSMDEQLSQIRLKDVKQPTSRAWRDIEAVLKGEYPFAPTKRLEGKRP